MLLPQVLFYKQRFSKCSLSLWQSTQNSVVKILRFKIENLKKKHIVSWHCCQWQDVTLEISWERLIVERNGTNYGPHISGFSTLYLMII